MTQETPHSNWHVRLRRILDTYFDQHELETLCFDLRFDFDELYGVGKSEKVVELIKAFSRMGRIEELIDYCSQLRPNVPWAELRAEAVKHPFAVEGPPERHETSTYHEVPPSYPVSGSAHRGAPPPPRPHDAAIRQSHGDAPRSHDTATTIRQAHGDAPRSHDDDAPTHGNQGVKNH
ncbi:MAG: hypothetical protein ACQERF_11610 [Actinomycetota bacterium]